MKNNQLHTPLGKELEDLKKKVNARQRNKKVSRLREFVELVFAVWSASVLFDLTKHYFMVSGLAQFLDNLILGLFR